MVASQEGHEDVVRLLLLLLQRGAFVNAQDGCQRNALSLAVKYGHLGIVETLQEHGATISESCWRK